VTREKEGCIHENQGMGVPIFVKSITFTALMAVLDVPGESLMNQHSPERRRFRAFDQAVCLISTELPDACSHTAPPPRDGRIRLVRIPFDV
jgi:hypothetical protein